MITVIFVVIILVIYRKHYRKCPLWRDTRKRRVLLSSLDIPMVLGLIAKVGLRISTGRAERCATRRGKRVKEINAMGHAGGGEPPAWE